MRVSHPSLQDLSELHPEVARSLSQLLVMQPEEVEGLGLVFQVGVGVGVGRAGVPGGRGRGCG